MITIVEGRGVGAGKSYYVCTRVLAHLSKGGTVVISSSFGLDLEASREHLRKVHGVLIEPDQVLQFDREETYRLHEITPQGTDALPVLIVLDECHQELNARDWNDQRKRALFNWLTQSRHDDCDVIFISQHAANIDKQVARLVTYIDRVRNMANFSMPVLGKWPLKQFVVARYDQDGRTLQERTWLWHDKRIFGCYRSKVMRGAHKRLGVVCQPKKLQKVKRHSKTMRLVILVMIIGGIIAGFKTWDRFNVLAEKEAAKTTAVGSVPAGRDMPRRDMPGMPAFRKTAPQVQAIPARRPMWEVVKEEFRATDERTFLRTVEAEYRPGAMCGHGLVVAIAGRVVKIIKPTGESLYVVAEYGKPVAQTVKVEASSGPEKQPESTPAVRYDDLSPAARGLGGYPARGGGS